MDLIDKILMETRVPIFTVIISYSCIVYSPFREAYLPFTEIVNIMKNIEKGVSFA